MKIFFIILLLSPLCCARQAFDAKKLIDSIVSRIEKRSEKTCRSFVLKRKSGNRKTITEKWSYSTFKGKPVLINVTYFLNHTDFSESFYLENGELIFVKEIEVVYYDTKPEREVLNSWTGKYYFVNRKLLDSESHGHGKSESEEWDPEKETLKKFDTRIKQLQRRLKIR